MQTRIAGGKSRTLALSVKYLVADATQRTSSLGHPGKALGGELDDLKGVRAAYAPFKHPAAGDPDNLLAWFVMQQDDQAVNMIGLQRV